MAEKEATPSKKTTLLFLNKESEPLFSKKKQGAIDRPFGR